jgi:hypothetical protein
MEAKDQCGSSVPAAGSLAGIVWFIGWLFTIGFVHLGFWKSVLALIIWPYFLGGSLR